MGRLRIEDFYSKIDVCNSDEELINICNLEKEYITNNYNTLESKKSTFTIYRTAFGNHYLKNKFDNHKDIFKAIIEISKNKITDIEILLQTTTKYHLSIIDFKHLIKKYDFVRILKLGRVLCARYFSPPLRQMRSPLHTNFFAAICHPPF